MNIVNDKKKTLGVEVCRPPLIKRAKKVPESIMRYIEEEILNHPHAKITIVRSGDIRKIDVITEKRQRFSDS